MRPYTQLTLGALDPQASMQVPTLQPSCSRWPSWEVELGLPTQGVQGCSHTCAEQSHRPHCRPSHPIPARSPAAHPREPKRWQL